MFLLNAVVLTIFLQAKELHKVFLGDRLWGGVGGGAPLSPKLLVLDDVGVCHILSVFEHTYIDTAIAPELGYNQLIRHKKSNCQMGVCDSRGSRRPTLFSKTLVFKKELPFLICYI